MTEFSYTNPDGERYSTKPLDLTQLTELMKRMPRIPVREFHCHPGVAEVLRNCIAPPENSYTWYDTISSMILGVPIFEDETMLRGAWKFIEDDEVTAEGNLYL